MGKYLDIFRGAEQSLGGYDKNDINDQTYTSACTPAAVNNPQYDFGRICRFGRSFDELERRCCSHLGGCRLAGPFRVRV